MTVLTDARVFEQGYVCRDCGLPPQVEDEPRPGWCLCNGELVPVDARRFTGEGRDVHLYRTDDGTAVADIPQTFVVHSPDGFEWGYGGSGPADLALNILGLFVAPPEAWRLHQDFKWDFIAKLDRGRPHTIYAGTVHAWIALQWRKA